MSVFFITSPECHPDHISLPGTTTIRFVIGSSLASEPVTIEYDLDPAGNVVFAGDGKHRQTNDVATASGTPVNQVTQLAGNEPSGTIVTIVVTITGADGVSEVAPAFFVVK